LKWCLAPFSHRHFRADNRPVAGNPLFISVSGTPPIFMVSGTVFTPPGGPLRVTRFAFQCLAPPCSWCLAPFSRRHFRADNRPVAGNPLFISVSGALFMVPSAVFTPPGGSLQVTRFSFQCLAPCSVSGAIFTPPDGPLWVTRFSFQCLAPCSWCLASFSHRHFRADNRPIAGNPCSRRHFHAARRPVAGNPLFVSVSGTTLFMVPGTVFTPPFLRR
jgi:hypothetical protein